MSGEQIKVLIVEDNPDQAMALKILLEGRTEVKYRVKMAGTLREGLDAIKADGIDVILLDIRLPDAQGLEVIQTVVGSAPETPVVILTGWATPNLERQAREAGIEGVLDKSKVEPSELSKKLQYVIIHRKHLQKRHPIDDALASLGEEILRLQEWGEDLTTNTGGRDKS